MKETTADDVKVVHIHDDLDRDYMYATDLHGNRLTPNYHLGGDTRYVTRDKRTWVHDAYACLGMEPTEIALHEYSDEPLAVIATNPGGNDHPNVYLWDWVEEQAVGILREITAQRAKTHANIRRASA